MGYREYDEEVNYDEVREMLEYGKEKEDLLLDDIDESAEIVNKASEWRRLRNNYPESFEPIMEIGRGLQKSRRKLGKLKQSKKDGATEIEVASREMRESGLLITHDYELINDLANAEAEYHDPELTLLTKDLEEAEPLKEEEPELSDSADKSTKNKGKK